VLLRNAPASDSHVIESKPGIGYKIGADHPAGTWETAGADGEQQCEWARKADLTDAPSSVIDTGVVGHVKQRVAVKAGEYFVSAGCLPWHYVG
jgi:hypothetical protein